MHTNTTHRRFASILGLLVTSSIIFGTVHGIACDFGRRYGASSRLLQRPFYFQNRRTSATESQYCVETSCTPRPYQKKKSCLCFYG